jgi:hypothetical protein
MATGNRRSRRARYLERLRPIGIYDELRGVLRADRHPWAWVMLMRRARTPSRATKAVAEFAARRRGDRAVGNGPRPWYVTCGQRPE